MSRQAKEKPHYVNNKELFSAMVNWKEEVTRAVNDNETYSVTPYIAECFVRCQMDFLIVPISSVTHTVMR